VVPDLKRAELTDARYMVPEGEKRHYLEKTDKMDFGDSQAKTRPSPSSISEPSRRAVAVQLTSTRTLSLGKSVQHHWNLCEASGQQNELALAAAMLVMKCRAGMTGPFCHGA
jgi:hypothetical protein